MTEETSEPLHQPAAVVVNQPQQATDAETFWTRHTLQGLSDKLDRVIDLLAGKADKVDVDRLSHRIEEVHASSSRRLEPLEEWKHASDATDKQRESFWSRRNTLVGTVITVVIGLVAIGSLVIAAIHA